MRQIARAVLSPVGRAERGEAQTELFILAARTFAKLSIDQAEMIRLLVEEDFARYSKKPGSTMRYLWKLLSHAGFRAVTLYRLGHWCLEKKLFHMAALIEQLIFHTCYCEIKTAAEIGPGFLISHTPGLVIGGGTRIGNHCDVRQNVTFGGNFNKTDEAGRTQPWLADNVSVAAGAVILGPVKIGQNAIIGANSVVTRDVPENVIVSGIPAQIIKERWSDNENRKL